MKHELDGSTVIITGAKGMLGAAFREVLATDYPGCAVRAFGRDELDVTDAAAVMKLASLRPQCIIHCAADVNADRCEEDPGRCREIQVGGTANVVGLATATGARVFFPQSFLIFAGGDAVIGEDTVPDPQSVYGQCKLEAENLIVESGVASLVVRMGGFFGGDETDKNFVGKFTRKLVDLLNQGETHYAVGDRVWQPTYTIDLARNSLLLLDRGIDGLWSMACEGEASFRELAVECVRCLGLQERIDIVAAPPSAIAAADVAVRPPRAVMSNARLQNAGLCLQRPWRVALAEYLSRPWFHTLFDSIKHTTKPNP